MGNYTSPLEREINKGEERARVPLMRMFGGVGRLQIVSGPTARERKIEGE